VLVTLCLVHLTPIACPAAPPAGLVADAAQVITDDTHSIRITVPAGWAAEPSSAAHRVSLKHLGGAHDLMNLSTIKSTLRAAPNFEVDVGKQLPGLEWQGAAQNITVANLPATRYDYTRHGFEGSYVRLHRQGYTYIFVVVGERRTAFETDLQSVLSSVTFP
jgi:hypothetical protein